jgi:NADPH-dependent F420 reductase
MVRPASSASVRRVEQQAAAEQQPVGSTATLAAVAVIGGTGKLGSALAARFARAGHAVVIGSRDAGRARLAASTLTQTIRGVDASRVRGADNAAAVAAADVVVITVPFDAQEATLRGLADVVGERVVVSTAVPVRFVEGAGPTHLEVEQGSASEQVATLLPQARVVGALHTVSSAMLAKLDHDLDADVLITGDDAAAKTVVAELLASLSGIRVVDGGPLRNSRYVEQLTVLLLSINRRVRRNTGIRITNLPDELALPTGPPASGRPT